jgi:ubiquinone biosynthesis protein COQ4
VAFVSKRIRQTRDLWHVLSDYRTDVAGEIALQAFTFAQMAMLASLLISVAGSLRWLREPRIARMAIDGYRRGRDAEWLPVLRWESL